MLKTVILRWPRSGPRRAAARAVHPSRLASLAPQDDGSLVSGFAGSARRELMAGQHGADGFDQLCLRHGALRFGLLLQMLLAALFQFGELGADDQILDGDLALGLLVGALDDDTR